MKTDLFFLTLKVFSATGGIEKVSRIAGKVFYDLGNDDKSGVHIYSLYDKQSDVDTRYFPAAIFKGFNITKLKFVIQCLIKGRGCNIVVLSHINLLTVGYLIKKVSPKTKIVLLAHG